MKKTKDNLFDYGYALLFAALIGYGYDFYVMCNNLKQAREEESKLIEKFNDNSKDDKTIREKL